MRRVYVAALAALVAGGGCQNLTGGGDASLAGTYETFFNFSASAPSIGATDTIPQALGTLSLGAPASDGSFSGSFVIQNDGGSGTISGVLAGDGGISISHFGDPGQAPLQALAYLESVLPACDFTQAVSGVMNGAESDGALALTGGLTLPCEWNTANGAVIAPTTITVDVSGSRS